jgi:hypothetical protein
MTSVTWTALLQGWIKLNTDGSFKAEKMVAELAPSPGMTKAGPCSPPVILSQTAMTRRRPKPELPCWETNKSHVSPQQKLCLRLTGTVRYLLEKQKAKTGPAYVLSGSETKLCRFFRSALSHTPKA